ncbi:MAG TPA: hypothetical protein VF715_17670 [Thermoleophilaceae bacterium]
MSTTSSDQYVRSALAGHLDERIVAAQWFRSPGGFEGKGLGRVLRGVFGGGDGHPADRLGSMNVLALTPTRLVAFAGRTGWGGLQVKEQIAEWPATEVVLESRARQVRATKLTSASPTGVIGFDSDIVSVQVALPGETRPLEMDMPADAASQRLLDCVANRPGERRDA